MGTYDEYFFFASQHEDMFSNPSEGGITLLQKEHEIAEAEAQTIAKLKAKGLPTQWGKVGIVFEDQFLLVLRDAVRFPDGSLGTYIRSSSQVKHGPGTAILPHYQNKILLIEQYRHATRCWHMEIPRGFGTESLSSEENARKELQEEIGAVISRLILLGQVHADTGLTSDVAWLFYADVESYNGIRDLAGLARMVSVSVAEFEKLIRDGKITDAFTLTAYTQAKLHRLI